MDTMVVNTPPPPLSRSPTHGSTPILPAVPTPSSSTTHTPTSHTPTPKTPPPTNSATTKTRTISPALVTPEREYLTTLQLLREKTDSVRSHLEQLRSEFPSYLSEDGWTESEYRFSSCLKFLASKNLTLTKLDSEACILSMINDLRATDADRLLIDHVTLYWDNFHPVMSRLQEVATSYQTQVLAKLLIMFSDHILGPASDLSMARDYSREIAEKITAIDKLYHRLSALCLSFQTKVEKDYMEKGVEGILIIVSLPRDVAKKLDTLVNLSETLISREEVFVGEMTCVIAECRKRKREYDVQLTKKRQLQLDKINSVNLATALLDKNKDMLEKLDVELEQLQTQLTNKENDLNSTEVELERDQNAIEFLSHTISTTKRNQRLLAKRQALIKTRQSLEQKLVRIKADLKSVTLTMKTTVKKKEEVTSSLEETKLSYSTVKEDLDTFMESLCDTEKEVRELQSTLIDVEILHCIKTSPENIDEIRDRPQSVKIAQSLREKITNKRLRKSKP